MSKIGEDGFAELALLDLLLNDAKRPTPLRRLFEITWKLAKLHQQGIDVFQEHYKDDRRKLQMLSLYIQDAQKWYELTGFVGDPYANYDKLQI